MFPFKNVAPGVNVCGSWILKRNLLVQLGSVESDPNLEAKAGKCWFARRDLQAYDVPLPPQLLVLDERFTLAAISHDKGMLK